MVAEAAPPWPPLPLLLRLLPLLLRLLLRLLVLGVELPHCEGGRLGHDGQGEDLLRPGMVLVGRRRREGVALLSGVRRVREAGNS